MSSPARLWFGNLNPSARTGDLRELLISYGEPANIWLAKNPAGFAIVCYADRVVAERICRDLHDSEWMDFKIEVTQMPEAPEASDSD